MVGNQIHPRRHVIHQKSVKNVMKFTAHQHLNVLNAHLHTFLAMTTRVVFQYLTHAQVMDISEEMWKTVITQ
jgi:hypothetical protein